MRSASTDISSCAKVSSAPPCSESASRAASCRLSIGLVVLTIAPAESCTGSAGEAGAWQHDRAARGRPEAAPHPRDPPTATDRHFGNVHLLSGHCYAAREEDERGWWSRGPFGLNARRWVAGTADPATCAGPELHL